MILPTADPDRLAPILARPLTIYRRRGKMTTNRELYVRNIAPEATEEDLRRLFSVIGAVSEVRLVTDVRTGNFMGSGYVEMESELEAKAALASLNGARLRQRIISVTEAQPRLPVGSKDRHGGRSASGKRSEPRRK
jgi:RNA recognition motif-containing protein